MNDYMAVLALTLAGLTITAGVFASGWLAGWRARDAAAKDEVYWARWLMRHKGNRSHKI